ncbi:MAG: SdpI family protein [Corynebacterium sp.]|nr:SdpI family protein [Corynebacterium sp.]
MARASQGGNLSRNSALGIRTKQTMRSDAAWDAAHKKSAPHMMASAMVGAVAIVLDIAFLIIYGISNSDYPALLIIVPIAGFISQIAVLVRAMMLANSEAKAIKD